MGNTDWKAWCRREKDVDVEREAAVVNLKTGRKQRVCVRFADESIELTSFVARRCSWDPDSDIHIRAWRRNRSTRGVGFSVDEKNRLMARAWMPMIGATKDEFLECLRHLAAEADLFEYQLTGKDQE